MGLFILGALAVLVIGVLAGQPAWQRWQRRRLRNQAFPAHWRTLLRRRVPLVARMPADLQLQLKKAMQVFIAETNFIGCNGLTITEEMRVVIAAQACLLLLNRPSDYFAAVRQILVYPGAFLAPRNAVDAAGVHSEHREALIGESWSQGQIILSWADTLEGAADPQDGRNVVIHEFAHQLDQENGAALGAPPPLPGDIARDPKRWSQVFGEAYFQVRSATLRGEPCVLDAYAGHDPAEFFAVASETFFERPQALRTEFAALYDELRGYYKVDPATW